jgi:hypothetical protein
VTAMRDLRQAAWERQRGLCAATGAALGGPEDDRWDLHHRLAGGMGGTTRDRDRLCNLVAVLSVAHNMGSPRLLVDGKRGRSIHTDPAWSRPLGLLLSATRGDDPAAVPVRIAGVGWVFLTDDGGWQWIAGLE